MGGVQQRCMCAARCGSTQGEKKKKKKKKKEGSASTRPVRNHTSTNRRDTSNAQLFRSQRDGLLRASGFSSKNWRYICHIDPHKMQSSVRSVWSRGQALCLCSACRAEAPARNGQNQFAGESAPLFAVVSSRWDGVAECQAHQTAKCCCVRTGNQKVCGGRRGGVLALRGQRCHSLGDAGCAGCGHPAGGGLGWLLVCGRGRRHAG